jgi:putative NADH-flavin reductase
MKIGVIGASGKAGRLIAAEAHLRGHTITAIVRDRKKIRNRDYRIIQKDLFNLTAEDLGGLDVVVDAFGVPFDGRGAADHVRAMEHLVTIFKKLPGTRLLVVGGAGSLYGDETKKQLVIDQMPEEWRAIPAAMAKAFEVLKKSGANWTYFSPAANFDPFGFRQKSYVLGDDVAAKNSKGESYIGYADYAYAMVDEIEKNGHPKARFTAAAEKAEFNFPPPRAVPYYGVEKDRPVFEGMSRYRPPLTFELAGKQFRFVFDNGEEILASFISGDTLSWSESGGSPQTEHYECAKIDDLTYFVNFEFERLKPRTNITLALDLEQSLVSKVKTWTRFDPQHPTLCENEVVFGAIALPGMPLPEKRHAFNTDLIGKRIHWHYSPELEIIHVYYHPHYQTVTYAEGKGWGDIPLDMWNAYVEANPYDEPAWYVKIKENIYLVSVIEQNMARRGMAGNSLLFLLDAGRVHDVGRSFGYTGQAPEFYPENYIFGAYGDFVYSDGVIEAKWSKGKG